MRELEILGKGGFGQTVKFFYKKFNKFIVLKKANPKTSRKDLYYEHHITSLVSKLTKEAGNRYFLDYYGFCEIQLKKGSNIDLQNVHIEIKGLGDVVVSPDKTEEWEAIAMEIGRCSLGEILITKRRMNFEEIIFIRKQLISQCAFLQRKGIAHADIKPDNIIVKLGNDLKYQFILIDFGIAKILKSSHPNATLTLSKEQAKFTPGFTPPEFQPENGFFSYYPFKFDLFFGYISPKINGDWKR